MLDHSRSTGGSASYTAIEASRGPAPAPLTAWPKQRGSLDPEQAAKVAVARRAKPGAPPGHVGLALTLELRQALAEQISARATREGKNLEAVVIDLLKRGSKR